MPDIGYYTLPVILSFKGIDKQVNDTLGKALEPAAKKAGEDFAKQAAEGVKVGAPQVKAATETVGKAAGEGMKKAGAEAGKQLEQSMTKATKEATTKVGTEVGKQLEQSITKSTTGSGGLKKAAKSAADEFNQGFREGVEQGLGKDSGGLGTAADEFGKGLRDGIKQAIEEHGGVASTLDVLSDKIKGASTNIGAIGDAFGVGTTGIQSASKTVTDAIDGISTSVTNTKSALEGFKTGDIAGGLQGTVDALKGLESVGLPEGFASELGVVADNYDRISGKVDPVTTGLKGIAELAPGSGLGEFANKLGLIGEAIKVIVAVQPELAKLDDYLADVSNMPLDLAPLENLRNILSDINAEQPGSPRFGGTPAGPQIAPPRANRPGRFGRAGGGGITGPGGPTSDIIPIWASSGEHMLSAKDVQALGGQQGVYAFRRMIQGFQEGGAIEKGLNYAAGISGKPYVYGGVGPSGFDCSGAQSSLYAVFTGKSPNSRYFDTESNFEALGFKPGYMEGAYNIGIRRGGGGRLSHMGATLPNGVSFEAGGNSNTVQYGGAARGAQEFPLKFYLPLAGGDVMGGGVAGAGGLGGAGGGGGGTGGGGGGGGAGGGGTGSGGTGGGGGGQDINAEFKKKAEDDASAFLGNLMKTGVGGIMETLGVGDWLPDFTQTPLMKSIAGGLSAFKGPLQGALEGKLGIQQPGWQPGQPVAAMGSGEAAMDTGGGSLNLGAFGLPNIALPGAPPAAPPGSGGLPGQPGGVIQNNDLSVTYEGNLGMDPDSFIPKQEQAQSRGIQRIPVIPGSPG